MFRPSIGQLAHLAEHYGKSFTIFFKADAEGTVHYFNVSTEYIVDIMSSWQAEASLDANVKDETTRIDFYRMTPNMLNDLLEKSEIQWPDQQWNLIPLCAALK